MEFYTLDDVELKGRTVFVRVDINSPIGADGKIVAEDRIIGYAETIKEVSDRGAKTIVLAHQGRAGDPDFITLEQHAVMLGKYTGKKVEYVPDVIGQGVFDRVKMMKDGEVILLENVRLLAEETLERSAEEHAKSIFVKRLSLLGDIYVNDAFSAAHRAHASIVGFATVMPMVAGRVMERELTSIAKAMENPKKPLVLVVGGAKPEDSLKIMRHWLEKKIVDKILTCGVVGELVLLASGCKLGQPTMDFLEKKKYTALVPAIKGLLTLYGAGIEMPSDVAVDKNGRKEFDVSALPMDAQIKDIGTKTAERYSMIIKSAGTVVLNGPAGVYEEEAFSKGTRTILKAITESACFSLVGGGNTISAIDEAYISKKKFSYISLAGKALISYLAGEPMPGVDALKKSKQVFKNFNGLKKR